ncbi:MAG: efflux RND transporter permease subunit [Gammaproteobacteria bacterium]
MLEYLVKRGLVVNLVSIFLIAIGVYAIFNINREALPNVELDRVQVDFVYPGSTPDEVERLIINPIEDELKIVDGVDKVTSVAFPGSGRVVLELDPDASNRSTVVNDIQLAVDRADLPADLPNDPVILEIDGRVFPVIQMAIAADRGEVEVNRLADKIRDDVLDIDGVARIQTQGDRKTEFRIDIIPEKLDKQHISIGQLIELLRNWNITSPGGDIETSEGQKIVRIASEFKSVKDLEDLIIRTTESGNAVYLRDVANITETLEKPNIYYDVSGKPALNMLILKKQDADVITVVDELKSYIKTIPVRYGNDVIVTTFQDFSRFAKVRLGVLTNNGVVGLVLVFISLILFLRMSVALTTTWGLPIVFFTGLFLLYQTGITLNLVSMLGFIMVLGMLVDDAIIIGENITYHMEDGMEANHAAVIGARELIGPVTTTILTTIAAFFPLMFMSGVIGKFIIAIPVVVISLLFFSWLESFLILPSHVAHFTNTKKKTKERKWLIKLENFYAGILGVALLHRGKTVLISFLILISSIYLGITQVGFQLFPSVGVDQFLIRAIAKPGISLEHMRERMRQVDADVRSGINPNYLEETLVSTGQIAMESTDPLTQRGSRFAQMRVLYIPALLREGHNAIDDMRALVKRLPQSYPDLQFSFVETKPGPPTGRALEVEITSNNDNNSLLVADNLIQYVSGIDGVLNVESSKQPGDKELHVVIDRQKAVFSGVDLATIATHVRTVVDGLRVTTSRRGDEEIDITLRVPHRITDDLSILKNLKVPNDRGGLISLSQISKLVESEGLSTIRHINNRRVVSVTADIDTSKITSLELNKQVADNEGTWLGNMKNKVKINYGGEAEKNQESFRDLLKSFGFALLAIFFILAIQFNNLSYPFIVMLAIPFGIVGIIISFFLHDMFWKPMPLSFFSTMGMVALTGVVVNSSLIMMVFIQRAREKGTDYVEAALQAGRRRLRAVILTATTTVVGLLPTAYGWGGMDPFVSPMALALSWGLAFATLVTLFTIPAAYVFATDIKKYLKQKIKPVTGK